jgi:hypothetical protein
VRFFDSDANNEDLNCTGAISGLEFLINAKTKAQVRPDQGLCMPARVLIEFLQCISFLTFHRIWSCITISLPAARVYVTDGIICDKLHDLADPGECHTVDMATARLAVWMHGVDGSNKMSLTRVLDVIRKHKEKGMYPHHYKSPKQEWWKCKEHSYNDNTVVLACIIATTEMQANGKHIFKEDLSYDASKLFDVFIAQSVSTTALSRPTVLSCTLCSYSFFCAFNETVVDIQEAGTQTRYRGGEPG